VGSSSFFSLIAKDSEHFISCVLDNPGHSFFDYAKLLGYEFTFEEVCSSLKEYLGFNEIENRCMMFLSSFSMIRTRRDLTPFIHQMQSIEGILKEEPLSNGIREFIPYFSSSSGKGVVVGCDYSNELFLEPWWNHYKLFNTIPVAFADFGMSKKARKWCCDRGVVFDSKVPELPLYNRFCIPYRLFLKYLAIALAPFKEVVWINLECKVQRNLLPIFELLKSGGLWLRPTLEDFTGTLLPGKYTYFTLPDEIVYDTGVIVTKKENTILSDTLNVALKDNHYCQNDSALLSRVAFYAKKPIHSLDLFYNCSFQEKERGKAAIVHYNGYEGHLTLDKKVISVLSTSIHQ
jgi:hypothetical protein